MRTARVFLLLIAALTAMSTVTGAQDLIDKRARRELRAPSGISLDRAVQMAQNRYQAKAVRAQTVNRGGRRVHEIRLLNSDGKVWTVEVDVETGAMN